jgi:WD40 repeat protein
MRNSIIIFLFVSTGAFAQVDSFPYFSNHLDDISCITFSPDGKYIVTGSWDHTAIIHKNDSTAETAEVIEGFRGAVTTMAFSRDGHQLIIGGQDGKISFYEFNDSYFQIATEDTSYLLENTQINKLIYGPGMRTIFSAGNNGKFITFDLVKKKMIPVNGTTPISAAAVAIDRMSYFIAVKGSPVITQFDIFGKVLNTFEGHSNDITDLLVTVDRKFLISSSKDKTIRIWDILNVKEDAIFTEHTWSVTDIDMDALGQYLVSSSLDGTVNLYNLKEKKPLAQYTLEGYKINALALSPDNTKIVAAAQPNGVSNPAGFFAIKTGIPARKIVLPAKMDLQSLRETNKKRALKIKKRKQEKANESTDSKTNKTGATNTPKSTVELLTKTKQVTITIKDNE